MIHGGPSGAAIEEPMRLVSGVVIAADDVAAGNACRRGAPDAARIFECCPLLRADRIQRHEKRYGEMLDRSHGWCMHDVDSMSRPVSIAGCKSCYRTSGFADAEYRGQQLDARGGVFAVDHLQDALIGAGAHLFERLLHGGER